jgi:hypothetical protein
MIIHRPTLAALFGAVLLASCSTTNEMPLAPNVVRLDTEGRGLIAASSASTDTVKRAAQATLKRGYTHFRLEQASTSQGSRLAGVYANTTGWGDTTFRGRSASTTFGGSTTYTPIRQPVRTIGVTVVMFRENEPGAKGAFDAADVLRRDGKI